MKEIPEVNYHIIQYIAVIGSLFALGLVIELIRRKKLKEQYALIWLFTTLILLGFSLWREGLEGLSVLMGIAYSPSALLLILLVGAYAILLYSSVILSGLSKQGVGLVQEVGLLRLEIEKLENELRSGRTKGDS